MVPTGQSSFINTNNGLTRRERVIHSFKHSLLVTITDQTSAVGRANMHVSKFGAGLLCT